MKEKQAVHARVLGKVQQLKPLESPSSRAKATHTHTCAHTSRAIAAKSKSHFSRSAPISEALAVSRRSATAENREPIAIIPRRDACQAALGRTSKFAVIYRVVAAGADRAAPSFSLPLYACINTCRVALRPLPRYENTLIYEGWGLLRAARWFARARRVREALVGLNWVSNAVWRWRREIRSDGALSPICEALRPRTLGTRKIDRTRLGIESRRYSQHRGALTLTLIQPAFALVNLSKAILTFPIKLIRAKFKIMALTIYCRINYLEISPL